LPLVISYSPGPSAVTHAQIEFHEYYDVIQQYAPEECINALQSAIKTIDTLLDLPEPIPGALKTLFGLGQLADKADFARTIEAPLGKSSCLQSIAIGF